MRPIADIMRSNKRFAILGGRTLEENARHYAEQQKAVAEANGPPQQLPDSCDLATHLARCAVPQRLADIIAAGPRDTDAVKSVASWLEGDQAFLLLHGETGTGKTLAACTIFLSAYEWLAWHGARMKRWLSEECAWLAVAELARGGYYDDESKKLAEHCAKVQLLVLDDLGAEVLSPPYLSTLERLVDVRFQDRRRRTVLTSNVSATRPTKDKASPFEARYGARIARRIRESGAVVSCRSAA